MGAGVPGLRRQSACETEGCGGRGEGGKGGRRSEDDEAMEMCALSWRGEGGVARRRGEGGGDTVKKCMCVDVVAEEEEGVFNKKKKLHVQKEGWVTRVT